jgi:UDP-N-acetylmuramate--alanine ligase
LSSPLESRRIWIAGIGGAGMSAYAVLARAWGAEVRGWDRVSTPYLEHLDGIEVEISSDPSPPPNGWESFVSTAFAGRVPGKSRAELLAELVSLRDSIVVSGAHGKTTTTAMVAFCLRELGHDPAWLIGADVPQLGGNAGTGTGWLVVEGDESDRTIELLRPRVAVVTNVDLDHHSSFASRAEVVALFERWLEHVPTVVRGDELEPYDGQLSVPGEHNRRNAAAALAALACLDVARDEAAGVLAGFTGASRRLERRGAAGDIEVYDDYAHHPAEVEAALGALRDGGRLLVLFQPHLHSRTRHLARELAGALAGADVIAVTDVYAARESPVPGVSGKLIVDAMTELRPGVPVAWTPALEDGAAYLAGRARPGDRIVTVGAGDVDRAGLLVLERLG